MPYPQRTRDQHFQDPGPKRILALDGGGLRGVLTLGYLEHVEAALRKRHGDDPAFRLCHYFDLIAGTSTGAIIAAALALGMSVEEVLGHYRKLGKDVFERNWLRKGILRAKYDEGELSESLRDVFGADTTLGDEKLKTGALIMTKRLDTGSPWPLGNNPKGAYFKAKEGKTWIPNGDYPLWKVVRASTAAPSYFDPETITIAEQPGKKPVVGTFVDGGVSPFNNPSLQALMYATLEGYGVGWPIGPEKIFLLSLGTGMSDPSQTPSRIAAKGALKALLSLTDDCAALVETMMQWISKSPTARVIDRELADLGGDLLAGAPLLTYLRYNIQLIRKEVDPLVPGLSDEQIGSLGEMDNPEHLETWLALGRAAAKLQLDPDPFPAGFDLGA